MKKLHILLLVIVITALCISAINPYEKLTWLLEVAPAIIGILILGATYKKFKFTNLTYTLIAVEMLILIIGGHYTYAKVPLFDILKDELGLSRNYYDRIGHLAQGFIPAMIIREILIRFNVVNGRKWIQFIVISLCLALSATYELLEFAVAKAIGQSAEAFLGTQGDVWDTQWDMLCAFIGASLSVYLLSKRQDKEIISIEKVGE